MPSTTMARQKHRFSFSAIQNRPRMQVKAVHDERRSWPFIPTYRMQFRFKTDIALTGA